MDGKKRKSSASAVTDDADANSKTEFFRGESFDAIGDESQVVLIAKYRRVYRQRVSHDNGLGSLMTDQNLGCFPLLFTEDLLKEKLKPKGFPRPLPPSNSDAYKSMSEDEREKVEANLAEYRGTLKKISEIQKPVMSNNEYYCCSGNFTRQHITYTRYHNNNRGAKPTKFSKVSRDDLFFQPDSESIKSVTQKHIDSIKSRYNILKSISFEEKYDDNDNIVKPLQAILGSFVNEISNQRVLMVQDAEDNFVYQLYVLNNCGEELEKWI